jgi:GNAT superfamily N-acetyltransferase
MGLATTPKECPQAQMLFNSMDYHLFVAASFASYHPARLLVDNFEQPRAAFLWLSQRGYVAGDIRTETFQEALQSGVLNEMPDPIRLYFPDDEWGAVIQKRLFPDRHVRREIRQYYTCTPEAREYGHWFSDEIGVSWLGMQLLGEEVKLDNHHLLESAIVSANPSFDDFLERGWGICALHVIPGLANYAGWCLAENIVEGHCEVGIETLPPFRRQGIAKAMVDQFISTAHELGFSHVGWHCWKDNIPSAKTALKAGFELEREYPVLVIE